MDEQRSRMTQVIKDTLSDCGLDVMDGLATTDKADRCYPHGQSKKVGSFAAMVLESCR